jgi:hypothetical protein
MFKIQMFETRHIVIANESEGRYDPRPPHQVRGPRNVGRGGFSLPI